MIEIKEVFDFVGEEIVVTKCVSVDSKEAKAAAARPIVSNSSGLFFKRQILQSTLQFVSVK